MYTLQKNTFNKQKMACVIFAVKVDFGYFIEHFRWFLGNLCPGSFARSLTFTRTQRLTICDAQKIINARVHYYLTRVNM